MKITVLGINFYPELIGIGVYNTELCEYLRNVGHEVTIFTALPYYPHWEIPEHYKRKLFLTENYKGVVIRRSYLYVPKKIITISRIFHEFSFMISSFFNLLFSGRPDIIFVVSPPLGLGLVAYVIGKIKSVPFVFHIQDLQPDAAVELGMLTNRKLLNLLYKIEKFIYQKAKRIGVISKKMGEKIISKEINRKKILYFPNWVDTQYIKPLPRNNKFRQENGLGNRFVVLYSGNIGMKQGLDIILDVADETKDNKNIIYIIAGDGAYKKELIRKYKIQKLENVFFLPIQSKEMLPYMLSAADVCLVPQQKAVTDVVMPSKLLGIMACGKPVIAGANPGSELYNVIKDSGCGIAVEPENPKQLLEAIMKLYDDPKKGEEYSKKAREYVINDFSKINILKSFEEKLETIKLLGLNYTVPH